MKAEEHLSKHIVGYATVLASVVTVLSEKLETGWPHTPQDWSLLILAAIGAACSTIIAYRAPFGRPQTVNLPPEIPRPPEAPKPNL